MTGRGEQQNDWTGPLLWEVLGASGMLNGATPREQAHLAVRVTGADGYAAVISLGEISPQLADRPILLADELNGAPLPDHSLRLIVPGDRLGARSVRAWSTSTSNDRRSGFGFLGQANRAIDCRAEQGIASKPRLHAALVGTLPPFAAGR
jgi:DMSO/TMAO reductase YedYZ molybdopterin-dependent catalytic subunit